MLETIKKLNMVASCKPLSVTISTKGCHILFKPSNVRKKAAEHCCKLLNGKYIGALRIRVKAVLSIPETLQREVQKGNAIASEGRGVASAGLSRKEKREAAEMITGSVKKRRSETVHNSGVVSNQVIVIEDEDDVTPQPPKERNLEGSFRNVSDPYTDIEDGVHTTTEPLKEGKPEESAYDSEAVSDWAWEDESHDVRTPENLRGVS
jgi:hypothetical protein